MGELGEFLGFLIIVSYGFAFFFEIVGFGMVTYLVINYFHKKKMNRIQLTDALKNRE
ncbi:MAG: hypothetical protein KA953_04870 [Lachnospiraceae bacterium]|nr:hypothetical protein [Lachnospiraceae bacterium]